MKLKSVNFSASNAKCSVKFASMNENLSHAAFDNNDCLFTFWANSEWSCKRHTGLFAIHCVYSAAFYSLMWMHLKFGKFWGFYRKPVLQHWHCHIVTVRPFKLSQYYTLADSHNVSLKCQKVTKILHVTIWHKSVITCS